jgi:hypothetical protein
MGFSWDFNWFLMGFWWNGMGLSST